jgi:hypothetical protein
MVHLTILSIPELYSIKEITQKVFGRTQSQVSNSTILVFAYKNVGGKPQETLSQGSVPQRFEPSTSPPPPSSKF